MASQAAGPADGPATARPPAPPAPVVHARGRLAALIRSASALDRTQSDPIVSARNALGLVLPLAIGAAAGNAGLGLASAIGALQTGFGDRPGPYRLRILRMAATALAAAITSGLAVALSRSDVASALLLLVVASVAGLLLATGPSGAQLGIAATGSALVLGHLPQDAANAVHVGLLVLIGGLGQAVLAVAAWPLGRHRPERLALARLYRALAVLTRTPPRTDTGPALGDLLADTRRTLFGLGHDHGPSVEAYRVLLDEADRIRREALLLSAQAERLDDAGADDAADAVRSVLAATGGVLDEVADSLEHARALNRITFAPARDTVRHALDLLDRTGSTADTTRRAAAVRVRALSGQLRAVVDSSGVGASEGRAEEEPARRLPALAVAVRGLRLRDPVEVLRANLHADSAVVRHAVRLAVLVAASDLITREAGFGRGYWVSLTIMVVLRPDFGSTFQRALMRVIGTVVGLVLATVLVHYVPAGQWYLVVLIGLFYFAMRFAGPGNIALGAVALSALVVCLLSLSGIAPHSTVVPRAVDTAIGGALALLAILAWPVWERSLLPARLGELLAAYRNYLGVVSDLDSSAADLQRARGRSRLDRSNAQASVDRARSEPVEGRAEVELGEAVLVHTHRFVHATMTLDALRPALRVVGVPAELTELEGAASEVLDRCEQAVRTGRAPRLVPKLRPIQVALAEAVTRDPGAVPDDLAGADVARADTAAALVEATDRIANSLDTLVSELRRQLAPNRDTADRAAD